MLGHIVSDYLRSKNFNVKGLAKTQRVEGDLVIDLTNFNELANLIKKHEPKFIVNCVGVLNKAVDLDLHNSILLNSLLPHFLANITNHSNSRVIQISTDCVFSGENGPYSIEDLPNASDYYGKTKYLGELNNSKDLTIRTSIVGPDLKPNGVGLFNWFSSQSESVEGYSNAHWSGVTTLQLAKFIHFLFNHQINGLIHYSNNEEISKMKLLQLFNQHRKTPLTIIPNVTYIVNKSLINHQDFNGHETPSYDVMIKEMMDWIDTNISLYPHYREV